MVIWRFKDNIIAKICTNEELSRNSVKLTSPGSDPTEQHTIKRKCVMEASKTLGVFKAADLSQTEEFNHLTKKANKFAKALISCPLSYMHAWLGYWTVCIPGITYSSSMTSLTEKQCDKIEHIIKPSLVKKLGLHDTFPNLMMYGDKCFGGRDRTLITIIRGTRNESNIKLNATYQSTNNTWQPNPNRSKTLPDTRWNRGMHTH
eukprot:scaffold141687_cov34-Attheya_sp.AAC.4